MNLRYDLQAIAKQARAGDPLALNHLALLARGGDRSALNYLAEVLPSSTEGQLRRLGIRSQDCQDILQDAWIYLQNRLHSWDPDQRTIRTVFFAILKWRGIDFLRRAGRRNALTDKLIHDAETNAELDVGPGPDQLAEVNDTLVPLRDCVKRLSSRERLILEEGGHEVLAPWNLIPTDPSAEEIRKHVAAMVSGSLRGRLSEVLKKLRACMGIKKMIDSDSEKE